MNQFICYVIDNFTKCGAFGLMVAGGAVLLMLICINGGTPPKRPPSDHHPETWGSE